MAVVTRNIVDCAMSYHGRKVAYHTEAVAQAAMALILANPASLNKPGEAGVYGCIVCGKWHWGWSTKNRRKAAMRLASIRNWINANPDGLPDLIQAVHDKMALMRERGPGRASTID